MGFRQPDVDVCDELLIGAALLAPSFCEDLSTWRLCVHRDGMITQELSVWCRSEVFDRVIVHLQSFAPPTVIADLVATASSLNYMEWKDSYSAVSTDLQQTSLTINLDGAPKRVEAYGPQQLAHEGDLDVIGYMRLWEKLIEIAPYRRTECQAAPREQVIQRVRSIFGEFFP